MVWPALFYYTNRNIILKDFENIIKVNFIIGGAYGVSEKLIKSAKKVKNWRYFGGFDNRSSSDKGFSGIL